MFKLPVRTWILNAAAVLSGQHGAVTRQAEQSRCSRETVYEHAVKVRQRLDLDPMPELQPESRGRNPGFGQDLSVSERVFLAPQYGKLVTLAPSRDYIVSRAFDVIAALGRAGIDYLFIDSVPPTVVRPGQAYRYPIRVKSKAGGVKFTLSSGPEGMSLSEDGLVTWDVPAGIGVGQHGVIITVENASGQTLFHSFTLRIKGTGHEQPMGAIDSTPRPSIAGPPRVAAGSRGEQARPPALPHREGAARRDAPRFRAAAAYATRGNTSGVAMTDLDGDGDLDLAAANRGSNGVDVLLGRGDGEFGVPTTYAAGRDPFTVAVADLDGDGKADLVTPNRLSNDVTVLPGRGDGTFGAPTACSTGGSYTRRVAVADLNGDGKPDLVAASYRSRNGVSVLPGRGDGTFGAPTTFPVGRGPSDLVMADVSGDGRPDLVSADQFGNGVSVLKGVSPRLADYFEFIDRYTCPTPIALPQVAMPRAAREALGRRIRAFVAALDRGEGPEALVLTGDDLNALLVATETEGRVHFAIEGDQLKGQVSVSLEELGLPGLEGRYFNGAATFHVSLRHEPLVVALVSAEVNGRPLPERLLAELRGKNLAESLARQPEVAAGLHKLKAIRIQDGKVIIEAKPNRERRPGLPSSAPLRRDQAARFAIRQNFACSLEPGLCPRPLDEAAKAPRLPCQLGGGSRCGPTSRARAVQAS
jgi:hypothetical protein